MFRMLPVERSSRTWTASPRARRDSARWEPMKPAPPVIRTVRIGGIPGVWGRAGILPPRREDRKDYFESRETAFAAGADSGTRDRGLLSRRVALAGEPGMVVLE